jgi:hypothetical protein
VSGAIEKRLKTQHVVKNRFFGYFLSKKTNAPKLMKKNLPPRYPAKAL